MPKTNTPTADETAAADQAQAAQAEKDRKAAEKAEAKARADQEKADAKAARMQEKIDKELAELPEEKRSAVQGTGDDGAVTLAARPKKAPMTLSQRRAMLKLMDGPVVAKTDFNKLPLDYLVSVGLAQVEDVTVEETYKAKEEQDVEIPEADRKEGGPTTKKVKVDVDKTRDVVRSQYTLTEKGEARAVEINPKWKTWKPASTETASAPAPVEESDAA
jgi:hypothetical protein